VPAPAQPRRPAGPLHLVEHVGRPVDLAELDAGVDERAEGGGAGRQPRLQLGGQEPLRLGDVAEPPRLPRLPGARLDEGVVGLRARLDLGAAHPQQPLVRPAVVAEAGVPVDQGRERGRVGLDELLVPHPPEDPLRLRDEAPVGVPLAPGRVRPDHGVVGVHGWPEAGPLHLLDEPDGQLGVAEVGALVEPRGEGRHRRLVLRRRRGGAAGAPLLLHTVPGLPDRLVQLAQPGGQIRLRWQCGGG